MKKELTYYMINKCKSISQTIQSVHRDNMGKELICSEIIYALKENQLYQSESSFRGCLRKLKKMDQLNMIPQVTYRKGEQEKREKASAASESLSGKINIESDKINDHVDIDDTILRDNELNYKAF